MQKQLILVDYPIFRMVYRFVFLGVIFNLINLDYIWAKSDRVLTIKKCKKKMEFISARYQSKLNVESGLRLAYCYFKLKKYNKALSLFKKFENDSVYRVFASMFVGRIYLKQKKMSQALQKITSVVELKERFSIVALYDLGSYFRLIKKKHKAKRVFRLFINKVKSAKRKKVDLDPSELGIKEIKGMVKKAKRYARRKRKRTVREQNWEINQPVLVKKTETQEEEPYYFYVAGRLYVDWLWKFLKDSSAETYQLTDKYVDEGELGPKLILGVGPYKYEMLVTRAEYNIASNWLTESSLIMEGEQIFDLLRHHMIHDFMLDQYIEIEDLQQYNLDSFQIGYHLAINHSHLTPRNEDRVEDIHQSGLRRIIPWVSVSFMENYRSRIFFRYDFNPNWFIWYEAHRTMAIHLSQDFLFPDNHINAYLEGFYGWNKYESTLLDTNTLGFIGVVDFVVHDMWSLRLASAYQRSNYIDLKIRYPFKGSWTQIVGGEGSLLKKISYPETVNLALNDLSAEFDVIFSPHDWHQFRFVVFGNYVSAFNEKVQDYDYKEIGISFYYQFAFPNNNFIRRKSRYGFFGLF